MFSDRPNFDALPDIKNCKAKVLLEHGTRREELRTLGERRQGARSLTFVPFPLHFG